MAHAHAMNPILVNAGSPSGPPPPKPARVPSAPLSQPQPSLPPKEIASALAVAQAVKPPAANNRFKGCEPLQFALWAHNQAYGSVLICIWLGIFDILWTSASSYGCKIDDQLIADKFIVGTCTANYTHADVTSTVCCDPNETSTSLTGNVGIGALYIVFSIAMLVYENADYCYGLWFPNDDYWYKARVCPSGILYALVGVVGLSSYCTALGGACLIVTGVTKSFAAHRQECGDGGREERKKARETKKPFDWTALDVDTTFNPIHFCKRIYDEDKLSVYVWTGIYVIVNVILFIYTINIWEDTVDLEEDGLLHGTTKYDCSSDACSFARTTVRWGPVSRYAPWAKGFGNLLNLNCSLILLPVIRLFIRNINNAGESFTVGGDRSTLVAKFCAHPITRYIPLSKNLEFHKLCAAMVFVSAFFHTMFHFFNLWKANETTLTLFYFWGWGGTDYLTGAIITFAMFIIYTAAFQSVRNANFEIFFAAHHWFIVFFFFLFLHGPVFIYWSIIPVVLYVIERYLRSFKGNKAYLITRVEWIAPVMALQFRPLVKEDFQFKEGQYLFLNCPYINKFEWHPFTISSASDDLNNGPRVALETGEEVLEVPRPKDWPARYKWNKYCPMSKDWRGLDPEELLDKSETGYNDYVSVHIKVHGLDDAEARSWTRKFKEYIELMNPGNPFPFWFFRRDHRGDIMIGRQYGPDGQQILRVDGPHAAPAEHYHKYGTVMIIGAGIGLTPCASILSALLKYRWKKNFNPEILHFYWVVRHQEIEAFQWLVHLLTDLEYELQRGRETQNIDTRYYCEINIFITGYDAKRPASWAPLKAGFKTYSEAFIPPSFTAEQLYLGLMNPVVDSKNVIQKMADPNAPNRFQDIWIWGGRPDWDAIFGYVKDQRQHNDIGVCFCGAPVIGKDLRSCCEKYSSRDEQCLFSLHKENF